MRKPTQNLIVDAAAFAAFVLMLGTGFLLRFSLPPGSGAASGLRGGGREYLTVWGLSRHEWGAIHYWISLALLVILTLHLVLHWQWIVSVVKGRRRTASGRRVALGLVGAIGVIGFAMAPIFSPVETQSPTAEMRADHSEDARAQTGVWSLREGFPEERLRRRDERGAVHIDLTLGETAARCGISPAALAEALDLPVGISVDTRLRDLQRRYGLTLAQVDAACTNRLSP